MSIVPQMPVEMKIRRLIFPPLREVAAKRGLYVVSLIWGELSQEPVETICKFGALDGVGVGGA